MIMLYFINITHNSVFTELPTITNSELFLHTHHFLHGNKVHVIISFNNYAGTILSKEKPDLVVITGDLVSGYMWNGRDKDWFYHKWRQLVEPMIVRNIR